MSTAHTALANHVRLEVQRLNRDARIFPRIIGSFRPINRDFPIYEFGPDGSGDLWGFLPGGIHFEIECKVGKDKLKRGQPDWQNLCAALRIPYLVCHAKSVELIPAAARQAAQWVKQLSEQGNE